MEIGIDCVDISRFNKEKISKIKFLRKIFTENEINYCAGKVNPSQHFAVRFAGKEALIKAFSSYGIKISFKKIEILNKKNGIPFVKILDKELKDFKIKISLSHSSKIAMAIAIVTKGQQVKFK